MCGKRRQADGRNLYITRACADVWKGTRQLVYELIVLSFSLPLSLPLSLFRVVRFVSVSFGLAFAVPFGLAGWTRVGGEPLQSEGCLEMREM